MYNFFKVKNEKALKIQRAYKRYRMKSKLALWAKRARLFKRILARSFIKHFARKYFKSREEALRVEEARRT